MLVLALIVATLALLISLAYAQPKRLSEGDVASSVLAGCKTYEEAILLILALSKDGSASAMAFMQEDDNSCSLGMVTYRVGKIVGAPVLVENKSWVILQISSEDRKEEAFAIVPTVWLQLTEL